MHGGVILIYKYPNEWRGSIVKKNMSILVILLISGGCSTSNKINVLSSNFLYDKELVWDEGIELLRQEGLGDSILYESPDGVVFEPFVSNENGLLFGIGNTIEDGTRTYVASYDLHNNSYTNLHKLTTHSETISASLLYANNAYVVFEEYDYELELSNYMVYDLNSEMFIKLLSIKDMPATHYNDVCIHNEDILMSIYEPKSDTYTLFHFNTTTNEMITVDALNHSNTAHSVTYFNDSFYYVGNDEDGQYISAYNESENKLTTVLSLSETDNKHNIYFTDLGTMENELLLDVQNVKEGMSTMFALDIKINKLTPIWEGKDEFIDSDDE